MPAEPTLADQLRAAITASGKSIYAIAQESKIERTAIQKFMLGKDIRLSTAGDLCRHFGLRLADKPLTLPRKSR